MTNPAPPRRVRHRAAGVSLHAHEQMAARFGYTPTRAEWREAVASILERSALLMAATLPNGKQRWRVRVGTVECCVIWASGDDTTPAQIVTVLPDGPALNPGRMRQRQQSSKGRTWGQPTTRDRYRPRYDLESDA
jgi:hypothetical protein